MYQLKTTLIYISYEQWHLLYEIAEWLQSLPHNGSIPSLSLSGDIFCMSCPPSFLPQLLSAYLLICNSHMESFSSIFWFYCPPFFHVLLSSTIIKALINPLSLPVHQQITERHNSLLLASELYEHLTVDIHCF